MRVSDCWPLSGYEGTGRCHWCGGEFKNKRQTRFCCKDCMDAYYYEFFWTWAAARALEGHPYCADCGARERKTSNGWESRECLEVHHIEPLNGEHRTWNVKNRAENLAVLCHDCHVQRHAHAPKPVPLFDYAGVEIHAE